MVMKQFFIAGAPIFRHTISGGCKAVITVEVTISDKRNIVYGS